MASFLKEMETIIKENEKLKEINKKNEQIIITQRGEIIDIKEKYRDMEEKYRDMEEKYRDMEEKYRDIEEKYKIEIEKQDEEWGEEVSEIETSCQTLEGYICDCLEFIMGDRGLINNVFDLLERYYMIKDDPYGASKVDEDLWESLGGFETIIEENKKLKDLKKNNSDWARIRGEDISKIYSNYSRVKEDNSELRRKLEEKYQIQLQPKIEILSNQSELIKFSHILKDGSSILSIGWCLYNKYRLLYDNMLDKNIELRIKLNEKNREISEILISLDKYKQDKISRCKKIG